MKEYLHIALAVIVLAALGCFAYLLVSYGEDRVKVKDLKDLSAQLTANVATTNRWHTEDTNARDAADKKLTDLRAHLDDRPPVIVRVNPPQGTLPGHPGGTEGGGPHPGGAGGGPPGGVREVDVTEVLRPIELKYGTALIGCQRVLDSWPH